ncbi:hypothetical protein E2C01_062356 [Portunus trituberculatus]|uniref:Uncharacterized protein n=1 Tax=Portunus trituberculatus TaxID=210409 RepID=A0A5B7HEF5_PORTR|nr:hypothetical protein [Portunus trituberculatus]
MVEDLNGQYARPEQPAAAGESGLLTDILPALGHLSLLDRFARDQTAPGSWAVSSMSLILFGLIAGISATQVRGVVSVLLGVVIKSLLPISTRQNIPIVLLPNPFVMSLVT